MAHTSREQWMFLFPIGVGIALACANLFVTQWTLKLWTYVLPLIPIFAGTIGFGLKNRRYGYLFSASYGFTCVAYIITGYFTGGKLGQTMLFVGGATLTTTATAFLLIWLIFWKLWRTYSSVKDSSGEVRPKDLN